MENQQPSALDKPLTAIWPHQWRDYQIILLLVVLALGLRAWVLFATEVPARDSIGFIRYALRFEKDDWATVVRTSHQHPGYPLAVMVVSWPIRAITSNTDAPTMQLSAQLVSALAGCLIVIPMFLIGRLVFSKAVGFWAALWFQCLPESGHVLSDAISDPLFLLFATWSVYFAMRAVGGNTWRPFVLCGLSTGLGYLVRPEAAIIVPIAGMMLIAMQAIGKWRRPWRKVVAFGTLLVASALITGSPYYLTTGCFTNKPSAQQLIGQLEASLDTDHDDRFDRTQPLFAALLAVHIDMDGSYLDRILEGIKALATEYAHAFQYIGWLPALLGLWWCRDRYREEPGTWILVLVFLIQGALVLWLAVTAGYASGRHILLLLIVSISQATAVIVLIPVRIMRWKITPWKQWVAKVAFLQRIQTATWSVAILVLLVVVGLSKTLEPLHHNRKGFHAAGMWLKQNTQPSDVIHDDHCWAHFYANRVFLEGVTVRPASGQAPRHFYVIGRSSERSEPTTPREMDEAELARRGGTIVFHWPDHAPPEKARVVVYEVDPY